MKNFINILLILIGSMSNLECRKSLEILIGVQQISPEDLQTQLERGETPFIVDIRQKDQFIRGHIPGALSISIDDLDGYFHHIGFVRHRSVVVVCNRGYLSLNAASIVSAQGHNMVYSLEGGMEQWTKMGFSVESGTGLSLPPEIGKLPVKRISWFEQLMATANGFLIKPIHMILSLLIIIYLWRKKSRDLVFIRWALAVFFIGEAACAMNYFLPDEGSFLLELIHDAGMVGLGTLLTWGLFILFDERVLHITPPDSACTLRRLCGDCPKRDNNVCKMQNLFSYVAMALALIPFMPLSVPLKPYNIFISVFGSDVQCVSNINIQLVQFRIFPLTAIILMIITFVFLRKCNKGAHGIRRAQMPFFIGLGFMMYSLFRFFLIYSYRDMLVWALFWEEMTELICVAAVGLFIWIFRGQLVLTNNITHSADTKGINALFKHQ